MLFMDLGMRNEFVRCDIYVFLGFLFKYIYQFDMKLYIYTFRVVCEDIYFGYEVTFLPLPSYMFILNIYD